tara:strand:- start:376 stop:675 length:300 start_codon:yes stop_codon:yes gene_type:complete
MNRLLLLLIATLALPIPVNAESYNAGVAKIQLPQIIKLGENAVKFAKMGDYEAACSKQREHNYLIKLNFEGLQELRPDIDWFDMREDGLELQKTLCSLR